MASSKRAQGRKESAGTVARKSGAERTREWRLRKSREGLVEFSCFVPAAMLGEVRRIVENLVAANLGQATRSFAPGASSARFSAEPHAGVANAIPTRGSNEDVGLDGRSVARPDENLAEIEARKKPAHLAEGLEMLFGSSRA